MTEADDVERSDRHARTHPRDKGAPPHWLRCMHVDEIDRQGHSNDNDRGSTRAVRDRDSGNKPVEVQRENFGKARQDVCTMTKTMTLVERLRGKLAELASECAECQGTGISEDTDDDCDGCDDIRAFLV
jgi:hypothetical protein